MILYDDFLQVLRYLRGSKSISWIAKEMGLSRPTIYKIKSGQHKYCQPPPIFTSDRLILPYPDHPQLPALINKLRNLAQSDAPIAMEDLAQARQFGLMDDEGTLHLPPESPGSPEFTCTISASQSGPTLEDMLAPDYIDRQLDAEVKQYQEQRAKPPPTPDPTPKPGYGRCPYCGSHVYLPCWACYLDSLCGPIHRRRKDDKS